MLASEALSELSRLSSYSPSAVEGRGGPAPLVRRQPAATEAARIPPPAPVVERRQRSAADVRSMLSGFQSGVTRGRAGSGDEGEDGDAAPGRVPVGAAGPAGHAAPASPTGSPAQTPTRTTDTSTTD